MKTIFKILTLIGIAYCPAALGCFGIDISHEFRSRPNAPTFGEIEAAEKKIVVKFKNVFNDVTKAYMSGKSAEMSYLVRVVLPLLVVENLKASNVVTSSAKLRLQLLKHYASVALFAANIGFLIKDYTIYESMISFLRDQEFLEQRFLQQNNSHLAPGVQETHQAIADFLAHALSLKAEGGDLAFDISGDQRGKFLFFSEYGNYDLGLLLRDHFYFALEKFEDSEALGDEKSKEKANAHMYVILKFIELQKAYGLYRIVE